MKPVASKPTRFDSKPKESVALSDDEKDASKSQALKVTLWKGNLTTAQKERDPWKGEVSKAWREFEGKRWEGGFIELKAWTCQNYPRYWSDTMVMLPALYSNDPTTVATKRFDKDPIAKTAGIILERLATYHIANHPFGKTMKASALDWLNSNRTTSRIYYDTEIIKRPKRVSLQVVEGAPTIDPATGQQIPGQPVLVDAKMKAPPQDVMISIDDSGMPYYEIEGSEEEIKNPRVRTKRVKYTDILVSPGASDSDEIWWMAYKNTITKKEAVAKFGAAAIKAIGVGITTDVDTDKTNTERKKTKDLFSYWEIWNKRDKTVMCLHDLSNDNFLIDKDNPDGADPYKLRGFYPSPDWLITNEHTDDVYSTPDYTQVGGLYEHLHLNVRRINKIVGMMKGAGLFDAAFKDLETLFSALGDGEGVAIEDFKDLMANGGLDQLLQFPPYEKLSPVLTSLINSFEMDKQNIDELRGIGDIIRGTSDPATSATAENIKKQSATNKFSLRQKDFAKFVRDNIELMCDLSLNVECFPDEIIKGIIGFNFLDQTDQNNFDPALKMLRDDESRMVRIDIETDSIVTLNEAEQKAQALELGGFVNNTLQQLTNLLQQPDAKIFIKPFMKVTQIIIGKFRLGKQAEAEVMGMFDQLIEELSAPPVPPPPPPEDPSIQVAKIQAASKAQSEKATTLENQLDRITQKYIEDQKAVVARENIKMQADQHLQQAMVKQLEDGTTKAIAALRNDLEQKFLQLEVVKTVKATQHQEFVQTKEAVQTVADVKHASAQTAADVAATHADAIHSHVQAAVKAATPVKPDTLQTRVNLPGGGK